jgi:hypothetical protein
MIQFNNRTPFEVEIALRGTFRILSSTVSYSSVIDSPPDWGKWAIEWFRILLHGPLNSCMTFLIPPWSECSMNICSDGYSSLTIGFNDVNTVWTRHTPGVYEWDSKDMELSISCKPGSANMRRKKHGPMVAGDIPLNIHMESSNETWEVVEAPITTIQYSPMFDNEYYESE